MNYVILRDFISKGDCNQLIKNTKFYNIPSDLGNLDNGFKSNTWIQASKRNNGLEYRYQQDSVTLEISNVIINRLQAITGLAFYTAGRQALVFCKYNNNGVSIAHRDRDKSYDSRPYEVLFQKYTCICLLTEPNRDYIGDDAFFMNFNSLTTVWDKGRQVLDKKENRVYPKLTKGDCIIFRNDISIHGVDPVMVKENQQGRITIGFRSL